MPVPASKKSKSVGGGSKKKAMDSYSISSSDAPVSYEVYHSAAMTFQSSGQYRKAIENYTKALDQRHNDKGCLIARAECYLQLGLPEKALVDADLSLQEDKNYVKGLIQKAESLYNMGQFEFALMNFHKGEKLRPEVQQFRLGIQKCQEAIENAIGENSGVRLTKEGDLSYFYQEEEKPVSKKPKSRQDKRKRDPPIKNEKTVKQLLGDLYKDKEYLEKILKETEDSSMQSKANEVVHDLALDCLNYLDTRSVFWQQQMPAHTRKKARSRATTAGEQDVENRAMKNLEKMDQMMGDEHYRDCVKLGNKVLHRLEKASEDLPNRKMLTANTHSLMGNAYLELGDHDKAIQHHNSDGEIALQQEDEEAKSRSLDNLGRCYARMGDYSKAISKFEEKLPLARTPLEKTWLYHELGRCHLEQDHYDDALELGLKSTEEAVKAEDDVWKLNATVLVAQAQVKLKKYEDALDTFNKALQLSIATKDRMAEEAVERAIVDMKKSMDDEEEEEEEQGQMKEDEQEQSQADRDSPGTGKQDGADNDHNTTAYAEEAPDADTTAYAEEAPDADTTAYAEEAPETQTTDTTANAGEAPGKQEDENQERTNEESDKEKASSQESDQEAEAKPDPLDPEAKPDPLDAENHNI